MGVRVGHGCAIRMLPHLMTAMQCPHEVGSNTLQYKMHHTHALYSLHSPDDRHAMLK
jgi:hypothetical protein